MTTPPNAAARRSSNIIRQQRRDRLHPRQEAESTRSPIAPVAALPPPPAPVPAPETGALAQKIDAVGEAVGVRGEQVVAFQQSIERRLERLEEKLDGLLEFMGPHTDLFNRLMKITETEAEARSGMLEQVRSLSERFAVLESGPTKPRKN